MFAPWRSQNSLRKRKDPITGNSFITSLLWRIKNKGQEGQDPLLHRIASFNFLFETKILPMTGSPITAQLEVSKIYLPFQAYSARRCEKKSVYS